MAGTSRNLPRRQNKGLGGRDIGALVGALGGAGIALLGEPVVGAVAAVVGAVSGWGVGVAVERFLDGVPRVSSIAPTTLAAVPSETTRFVGRGALLADLTSFLKRDQGGLFLLRGVGGCGKSATLLRSLEILEQEAMPEKRRAHGPVIWSFYLEQDQGRFFSQLAETLRPILADHQLQRLFGRDGVVAPIGLGAIFAELDRSFVLVLDGLERVQGERGEIAYPALASLITAAARGECGGLKIIVTSRLAIPRLGAAHSQVFLERVMDQYPPSEAVAFMEALGVRGDKAEILRACGEYHFHVYSMKLLATGLRDQFAGNIRRRDAIPDVEYDDERRIWKVLRWYKEAVLSEGQLSVLEATAILRSAASPDTIFNVLGAFAEARRSEAQTLPHLISRLRQLAGMGLVFIEHDLEGRISEIDLHPLVRDFFYESALGGDRLGASAPLIHRDLARQLSDSVPGYAPQNRSELDRLVETIYHLIRAGDVREAFDIYNGRLDAYRYIGLYLGDHALGAGVVALFRDGRFLRDPNVPQLWKNWLITEGALYFKNLGRLDEAIEMLEEGIGAAERAPSDSDDNEDANGGIVVMMHNLSGILLLRGRTQNAIMWGERALARLSAVASTLPAPAASRLEKECRSRIAGARAVRGDTTVLSEFEALRSIEDNPKEPPRESSAIRHAWLLSMMGRGEEALTVVDEAIAFHGAIRAEMIRQRLLAIKILVLVNAGRVEDSMDAMKDVASWASGGDVHMHIIFHRAQARLLFVQKDFKNALGAAQAGSRLAASNGFAIDWNDLRLVEAECHLALANFDDALAACLGVTERGEREGGCLVRPASDEQLRYVWALAAALDCRGRTLTARNQPGDRQDAILAFEQAVQLMESLSHFETSSARDRLTDLRNRGAV